MKYRKKPVVVEAMEFTGENGQEVMFWAHQGLPPAFNSIVRLTPYDLVLEILTPEGVMTATRGDFIIKGIKNEFYPCKPDIFEATYELVEL